MKLRAKAKGHGIGGVVLSFFNYITQGSSISVNERTVKIEIFFDEPPTGLLQALTECEDFELEFRADNSEELDKEEKTDDGEERKEEKAEEATEKEEEKVEETAEGEEEKAEETAKGEEEKAEEIAEGEEVKVEDIAEREEVKVEKVAEGEETKATEEVTKRETQSDSAVSTITVKKPKATSSTQSEIKSDITDNETVMYKKFYAVSKKRQLPTKEQCYAVEAVLKIANSSTSYEEFIEKTADFLEIEDDRKERFVELITKVVAPYIIKEGKSITWSKIEAEMERSCKKTLKTTDRICYINAVEKNIKVVKLSSFINILGAYSKFYVFEENKDPVLIPSNNKSSENVQATTVDASDKERKVTAVSESSKGMEVVSVPESLEETEVTSAPKGSEEALAKESNPITRETTVVKFNCMPSIPWFEKKLSELNLKESRELKVREILKTMGLNSQNPENQSTILSIANAAVLLDKIDYNSIFEKAKIKAQDAIIARMVFSKFINEFISQNGGIEKIKMIDFLEELKSIVNH